MNKSIGFRIYIFILGLLGFSVLGQLLLINGLHFPFSIMEIFYIPVILMYKDEFYQQMKNFICEQSKAGVILLFFIFTGAIFGVVHSGGAKFLVDYRAIIYLLVTYYFSKNSNSIFTIDDLLLLNSGALIGELIATIMAQGGMSSSTNCLAMAICIIGYAYREKYLKCFIFFIIAMSTGILSGFRLGIIVSVICLVIVVVFTLIRGDSLTKGNFVIRITVIVFCVYIACNFIYNYETYISIFADAFNMEYKAVFRITERMTNLLKLDFASSQDTERLNYYRLTIERFLPSICPRGLIESVQGLYIDVPLLYFYDIFGSITTLGIVLYWGGTFVNKIKYMFGDWEWNDWEEAKICKLAILLMPLLAFLLVVNETAYVVYFQAIEVGFILGKVKRI